MSLVVEEQGQHIVPLWINGRAHPIVQERVIEVINAAEGNVVHYAQCADADDAKAAVEAAAAAFPAWSTSSYISRRILDRFGAIDSDRSRDAEPCAGSPTVPDLGATWLKRYLYVKEAILCKWKPVYAPEISQGYQALLPSYNTMAFCAHSQLHKTTTDMMLAFSNTSFCQNLISQVQMEA
ncbi:hypothetical protein CFAM422_003207 [Trichoderma lentiforme]|uniref:Aldehyde dehydrogenase domain-containing protein n=1 Tax=Trichoderma lentiforme TaxID=1567552 RepID=A0A9P4XN90_9HYPO|nr:hypothetical protein CFAM422_003207 [Trichoderma lentiforme]